MQTEYQVTETMSRNSLRCALTILAGFVALAACVLAWVWK